MSVHNEDSYSVRVIEGELEHTNVKESSTRSQRLAIAWILVSSVTWAAVAISTGDVGWPLVEWAVTTFAPLSESFRAAQARRGSSKPVIESRLAELDPGMRLRGLSPVDAPSPGGREDLGDGWDA